MDGVKKVTRSTGSVRRAASADHRQRVQKSSTLNRRFVKKPVASVSVRVTKSAAAASQTLRRSASSKVLQPATKPVASKTATVLAGEKIVIKHKVANATSPIQRSAACAKRAQAVQQSDAVNVTVKRARSASVAAAVARKGQSSYVNLAAVAPVKVTATKSEQKNDAKPKVAVKTAPVAKISRYGSLYAQNQPKITVEEAMKAEAARQALAKKPVAAKAATTKKLAPVAQTTEKYQQHQMVQAATSRMAASRVQAVPLSSKELKDKAIRQALSKMDAMDKENKNKVKFSEAKPKRHASKRGYRYAFMASMAVFCVAVLGYFVYLNMPDISVRVAAMQAGIERSYPNYVPMSYRLDGLVQEENGHITMNFKDESGKTFSLTEEKTAWDSAAVLTNYVKKEWGNDYSIAKGQGLTIYVSGSNAVWVNGGVLYIVEDASGSLGSSDLHDIAVSL